MLLVSSQKWYNFCSAVLCLVWISHDRKIDFAVLVLTNIDKYRQDLFFFSAFSTDSILFYPFNTMLVWVLAMSLCLVCLSVCLLHAGIVSKQLHRSSWFLAYRFPTFILPFILRKLGYLQNPTKFWTLRNFGFGTSSVAECDKEWLMCYWQQLVTLADMARHWQRPSPTDLLGFFLFSLAHCLAPAPLKLRPYGNIQLCLLLVLLLLSLLLCVQRDWGSVTLFCQH